MILSWAALIASDSCLEKLQDYAFTQRENHQSKGWNLILWPPQEDRGVPSQ